MNFSVYFNLIIGTFKKQLMKNGIMFLLIALSISMAVIGIHASKQYTTHFKKLHEFIGSNVSYITNATQFHKYMFENEPIEQEIINQLHGNSNIIAAYPYVAFERFNRVSDISYYLEDEVNSSLAILNENNNSFQNLEIFNYEVK